MKKISAVIAAMAFATLTSTPAQAQNLLTGDTKLACEAILCLSSPTRPGACMPSLARYFGISHRKIWDTIRGRINFLNLCPVVSNNSQMQSLVNALGAGAGRCDAQSLNIYNRVRVSGREWEDPYYYVSNKLPDYCGVYFDHPYAHMLTTIKPKYVGSQKDGYWVEANQYSIELKKYNERKIYRANQQREWSN